MIKINKTINILFFNRTILFSLIIFNFLIHNISYSQPRSSQKETTKPWEEDFSLKSRVNRYHGGTLKDGMINGFNFSLRCMKEINYSDNNKILISRESKAAQIHLSFDSGILTQLRYETSIDAPHDWSRDSEIVFRDLEAGGESRIKSTIKFYDNGLPDQIDIVLSNSYNTKADGNKIKSNEDLIIEEVWHVKNIVFSLMMEEKRALFKNGSLVDVSLEKWSNCKLMNAQGKSFQ